MSKYFFLSQKKATIPKYISCLRSNSDLFFFFLRSRTVTLPNVNIYPVCHTQGADDEYRSTFEISSTDGKIYVKRKLDYEKHSFYIFKVGVKVSSVMSVFYECRRLLLLSAFA